MQRGDKIQLILIFFREILVEGFSLSVVWKKL